jgi:Xaa-Pro aminopeptidase
MKLANAEYDKRVKNVQAKMEKENLDLIIAHSHEADFANVRYLSDYWPIFESAGVAVPRKGAPCLLIGPESETFAEGKSRIKDIFKLVEYRESAEPDYPDIDVDTFEKIFKKLFGRKKIKSIGLAGYQLFPLPVYEAIKKAAPGAVIKKTKIISELRTIKSNAEIKALKEAFRISEIALSETLNKIKPGMTELEVVGIIQQALYANGAEYEAHPQYVLSGKHSTHAIGRPGYRKLAKGDLVQLNIGARVAGYSASVGRPVCIGKMAPKMRELVSQGLELHYKTIELIKAGVQAKSVVKGFFEHAREIGAENSLLYGPCHGLGMMEVEEPWMESHSEYKLKENMTFQVDTFLYGKLYGLRWENGVIVAGKKAKQLSGKHMEIIEL